MTVKEVLSQAFGEHQKGHLDRAEVLYRQILGKNPKHPDALNFLGMVLAETGRAEEGVEFMRRAIEVVHTFAPFHANLGETYRRLGKLESGIASLKRAIELNPKLAEAQNNLSAALCDLNRWDEAITAARQAVEIRADFAGAHFNLGNALQGRDRHDEAIGAYRTALQIQPGYFDALLNLGGAYEKALNFDEAVVTFSEAVRVRPDSSPAYNNLAVALDNVGRGQEALLAYAEAVRLDPNNTRAQSNYGNALAMVSRLADALAACRKAAEHKDADADTFAYLSYVYKEKGDLDAAQQWCAKALVLEPENAAFHNGTANILKDMAEIKAAIKEYRKASSLAKNVPMFHSNLLYALYCDPDYAPEMILQEHMVWEREHGEPLRNSIRPFVNDRNPDRRLRIGYVSPDFRAHLVGRFMMPILANHDHGNFEIFCYASVKVWDEFTQRMVECVDVWRDMVKYTHEQMAEMIRADGIDILVDLSMHAGDNRLTVFARKPAPVQVTYLAYAGTTGLKTIDYRITDPWLDPPGEPEPYTETSVRVSSYWCYEPLMENLPQTPLPASKVGSITFGCLNNFCKVTRGTQELWRRILREVVNSRLLLYAAMGKHRDGVRKFFADGGVEQERIAFVERLPLPVYMEQYGRIDIGLDPFPYVGGTTTCDALWMGVPVVTLAGKTAISRGGVSIMNNVGLPELVAQSTGDYVRIAMELACDRERLEQYRQTMRERMKQSPLMDAKRFTREMEEAYRGMWRKFVGK